MALDLSALEQPIIKLAKYQLEEINTDLIDCTEQMRSKDNPGFSFESLTELGNSFIRDGQSEPAIIRPNPKNKQRYIMIAGERRYRACKLMGLKLLCLIRDDLSEEQILRIQRNENNQRVNLTQLEVANALLKDKERLGSLENVAIEWHKSVNWVSERLKYLDAVAAVGSIASQIVKKGITSDITAINDFYKLEKLAPHEAEKLLYLFIEQPEVNIRSLIRNKLRENKGNLTVLSKNNTNKQDIAILLKAETLAHKMNSLLVAAQKRLDSPNRQQQIKYIKNAINDLQAFISSFK